MKWKLAEGVFNQPVILIIGGIVPTAAAAMGYCRTGKSWFLLWGGFAILVFALRLLLDVAFARRRNRVAGRQSWMRAFTAGACANGLVSGLGAAGAVLFSDAFTQMLVITLVTAFVMGSASRNAAHPAAAIGSIILAEGFLILACFASRDAYMIGFSLFAVLFSISAFGVVKHRYGQTVQFLITLEEKADLVNLVSAKNDELAAANERLEKIACTDALTGTANRRFFDQTVAFEYRRARRNATPLAVIMLDIDSFKSYNDRYGHQGGDDCLRTVATTMRACLSRAGDMLARYGGEEFIVLLPGTNAAGALAIAESIRAAVEELALEHASSAAGVVTVSLGAAELNGDLDTDADELIRRADSALYAAKHAGRNRVMLAADAAPREPLTSS